MNQDQQKPNTPSKGPDKTGSSQGGWKKFIGKKWAFPAIYMAAAAIILTLMWWYQDPGKFAVNTNPGVQVQPAGTAEVDPAKPQDAAPVQAAPEKIAWPVQDPSKIDVSMDFYDNKSSDEAKTAALIEYQEQWYPHTGLDLAAQDGKTFDVTAAMSGKVTLVENHAAVGNQIEITHDNGLVTVYQSLSKVTVKEGDQVTQGQVIGQAGRNTFEKEAGVHVHFEIRKDNEAVNPNEYLTKQ